MSSTVTAEVSAPRRVDFGHRTLTVRRAGVAARWSMRSLIVCAVLAELAAAIGSALVALLLITADVVAQHMLSVTLPVGVVTVIVGGAYLVWLIIHEVRRRRA